MTEFRGIRYQAALVEDHHLLLLRPYWPERNLTFWLFPGGGMEAGESEEECIVREMREETHLDVRVVRLLAEEKIDEVDRFYDRKKTFLVERAPGCGEVQLGEEPEFLDVTIAEYGWFDLRDESSWPDLLRNDVKTQASMSKVRKALGYLPIE